MKNLARGVLLCAISSLLFAASPTLLNRSRAWPTDYGMQEFYYQAVPTSLTDVAVKDARLIGYCVYNSSGGSLTFTIQTKDASPLALPMSGAITAGQSSCNNTPFGMLSKGGFSVQSSGAGLYYSIVFTN